MNINSTNRNALYARICVREPYFALQNLHEIAPGETTATIPVELPATYELGPITAAEAARHTAILGSCAVASVAPDDRRRYYLATHCDIAWLVTTPACSSDSFIGYATGGFRDSRNAYAHTTLIATTGRPVARIDVDYTSFTEEAFGKIFARLRRPDLLPGPYAENPTRLPCYYTE
ncbi:hypothetical protein [Amycolatopsis sp. cmx-11-12]|uniref:hypothetical protein n=1 Tax=Amycolatopsis sp. cmx-11-12 TaxID=2785795 RepID=UPI0039183E90